MGLNKDKKKNPTIVFKKKKIPQKAPTDKINKKKHNFKHADLSPLKKNIEELQQNPFEDKPCPQFFSRPPQKK